MTSSQEQPPPESGFTGVSVEIPEQEFEKALLLAGQQGQSWGEWMEGVVWKDLNRGRMV